MAIGDRATDSLVPRRRRDASATRRRGAPDAFATTCAGLTRRELRWMLEMGHACVGARSFPDLEKVIDRLGTVVAFRKAAVCSLDCREGVRLRHFVNHSYGGGWADVYVARDYVSVDPVIRHARSVEGAFDWKEAVRAGAGTSAREFLDAAHDFGLSQGASYSCATGRDGALRTVMSLVTTRRGETERAVRMLAGIGPHVHEAYARLCAHAPPRDGPLLTPREKDILRWAREGKTYWEIGQILGIAQRTVKFHFVNIRAKLDAVSECHAVAKAMSLGVLA